MPSLLRDFLRKAENHKTQSAGCRDLIASTPSALKLVQTENARVDLCTRNGEIHRLICFLHLLPQFDRVHTSYQLMTGRELERSSGQAGRCGRQLELAVRGRLAGADRGFRLRAHTRAWWECARPDWIRRFIRGSAEDAKFGASRGVITTQP